MKLINIVGARPNLVKIASLIQVMRDQDGIEPLLLHTGQHYDWDMSDVFFQDLELPFPDFHLGVGSGSHAQQTAQIMVSFEQVLQSVRPDLVLVLGDVNSTLACSIVAAKLLVPVAHVEAGLRSFDRSMPEEINRIVTDALSDFLFTPSPDADENLKKEGVPKEKIFLVGNVMVDSLLHNLEKAKKSTVLYRLGLINSNPTNQINQIDKMNQINRYALLTLHRPSNVDDKDSFLRIINALTEISKHIPIVFPIHPRTGKKIEAFGFEHYFVNLTNHQSPITNNRIYLVDPLGYLDFLNLMMHSTFVMTDSGGIQEETTALGIPCLTLRKNTERPVTVIQGTNTIVGTDPVRIVGESRRILDGLGKRGHVPDLWDGKAAERIVEVLQHVGLRCRG